VRNTEELTGGMTGPQADRLRTETKRKLSGWGDRKEKAARQNYRYSRLLLLDRQKANRG
jgi:hypothetical protein